MKSPVIAVFDKKTALYGAPSICRHVNEAIREFNLVAKEKSNKIGNNPEDFDLFWIGEYDDTTSQIENLIPPKHLATGIQ